MQDQVKAVVRDALIDAGYSDPQIARGFQYADEHASDSSGYDEVAQLTVSRILYSDDQLNRGQQAPWDEKDYDWGYYEDNV